MGRVTIDLGEVAIAKGRRLARWFPLRFVEDYHQPWQASSKSEHHHGYVHENDGDEFVSSENKRSEVYLEIRYYGSYYEEFDALLKHKFEKPPPKASGEELFQAQISAIDSHCALCQQLACTSGGKCPEYPFCQHLQEMEDSSSAITRSCRYLLTEEYIRQETRRHLLTSALPPPGRGSRYSHWDSGIWKPRGKQIGPSKLRMRKDATDKAPQRPPFVPPLFERADSRGSTTRVQTAEGLVQGDETDLAFAVRISHGGTGEGADAGSRAAGGEAGGEGARSGVASDAPVQQHAPWPYGSMARPRGHWTHRVRGIWGGGRKGGGLTQQAVPVTPRNTFVDHLSGKIQVVGCEHTTHDRLKHTTQALKDYEALFSHRLKMAEPPVTVRNARYLEASTPASTTHRKGFIVSLLRLARMQAARGNAELTLSLTARAVEMAERLAWGGLEPPESVATPQGLALPQSLAVASLPAGTNSSPSPSAVPSMAPSQPRKEAEGTGDSCGHQILINTMFETAGLLRKCERLEEASGILHRCLEELSRDLSSHTHVIEHGQEQQNLVREELRCIDQDLVKQRQERAREKRAEASGSKPKPQTKMAAAETGTNKKKHQDKGAKSGSIAGKALIAHLMQSRDLSLLTGTILGRK